MRETVHRGWAKSVTVAKNNPVCRVCVHAHVCECVLVM